jgi:DNA (cytosine-5)-methyltransferase 1
MAEIRELEWNGFNAVSTFSGCGGSSTGDRMAGFRIKYASEFIPAAQETYRANMAAHTYLDTRDIREVTGAELLAAAGLGVGEIDLFDGSPPCASFSTAGALDDGWGKVKKYSDTTQRTDDLFFEYIRLIKETQPRTFVAENVAGLVRGVAKGYFLMILKELKAAGYQVSARVLNAAWLGVPQVRNRLILVGVRNDLAMAPVHPAPLPYQYTVRDALPYIGERTRAIHDTRGSFASFCKGDVTDTPAPPITGQTDHHVMTGDSITQDPETGQELSMIGYAVYEEWKKLRPGEKSKKYFHVKRQHQDQPYDTLMANQGETGTTGPAHWSEPRKLTLIELRALGGFPADFVLTGTYVKRWERIGRAVPPIMMARVAAEIRDQILIPLREAGKI